MNEGWHFKFLGYPLALGRPWALPLLVAAVLAGLWAALSAARRPKRAAALVSERLVPKLAPGVQTALVPLFRSWLYTVGMCLLAVALTQPRCGSHTELIKRRGIDVVVALDASKSMLARDVQPNRLERAKLELLTLLDELKGDRVGLVVFAGDAFIQCPLTSDYAAAKMFLKAVDPHVMPQGGTNIGAALLLSRKVFNGADRGAKERVVVLISDGEDLEGEVKEGVEGLKEDGVRVEAVGIGSESGEPIPVFDKRGEVVGYQKDAQGNTVLTRLDRTGLTAIAQETGGELFYEPHGVAMGGVLGQIEKLQKSELESRLSVRYEETFQYLGFPGLVFLALGMALPNGWRWRARA